MSRLTVSEADGRLQRISIKEFLRRFIIDNEHMKLKAATERTVEMPREITDEQADAAMRATAVHLDIKGSQLTVNREKMKARYRALVKFIEANG